MSFPEYSVSTVPKTSTIAWNEWNAASAKADAERETLRKENTERLRHSTTLAIQRCIARARCDYIAKKLKSETHWKIYNDDDFISDQGCLCLDKSQVCLCLHESQVPVIIEKLKAEFPNVSYIKYETLDCITVSLPYQSQNGI